MTVVFRVILPFHCSMRNRANEILSSWIKIVIRKYFLQSLFWSFEPSIRASHLYLILQTLEFNKTINTNVWLVWNAVCAVDRKLFKYSMQFCWSWSRSMKRKKVHDDILSAELPHDSASLLNLSNPAMFIFDIAFLWWSILKKNWNQT